MKSTLLVSEWVGGVGGDGVGWRVCTCAVAIFNRWYCYVWFVSGAGGECLYT